MHQVNWSQFGNSLIYSIVLICYTVEPLNFEVLLLVVDVGVGVDVGAGAGVGAGVRCLVNRIYEKEGFNIQHSKGFKCKCDCECN